MNPILSSSEKSHAFTLDQMLFPPPDLAIEIISPSTEKNDRKIKFADYAAHGISEYWIVDPEDTSIEQYLLDGYAYKLKVKLADEGMLHAREVNGFTLNVVEVFIRSIQ